MASVKVTLRTNKQKSNGTCPLAIRITKDRKSRYIFTGFYIQVKDWDQQLQRVKKSCPNSTRLNNLLLVKVAEANKLLIEAETNDDGSSSKEIKNRIKRVGKTTSFFELAGERIEAYKQMGTFSVANADQNIVNNLKKFVNNEDLSFKDITVSFINNYKVYAASVLGHSNRTITNHLIFMRTLHNVAIKKGITNSKNYPFGGDNIKIRIGSGLKIGLTKLEIEKIEKLEFEPDTTIWHTRNIWLFAFYFAGIRISDVIKMKWSDFKDGRLNYIMGKNQKPVSLKVPDKANEILKQYEKNRKNLKEYIFPFLKDADHNDPKNVYTKSRNAARLFNKYLKRIATIAEIDKNLTNHIARHSFGNIAGDQIHPLMLQKLYRHFDLKTTINYQANFIHKEADEALDKVINF